MLIGKVAFLLIKKEREKEDTKKGARRAQEQAKLNLQLN